MSDKPLGRLERVSLRHIWETEAQDFTPWLAREENLEELNQTLHLDLEFEAQEKTVGPFRADILCRNLGDDSLVLIENQLERTDHIHLGQLLTYAAGLHAVTIVWIAARFTEEHRAALDWLNEITGEHFRFFGLEVELWRIGKSDPAPKFNVVSQPNGWSKSVATGFRNLESQELSDVRQMQLAYWTALQKHLEGSDSPVVGSRSPRPRSWYSFKIGRAGFRLSAVMLRQRNSVRAELYISGEDAKRFFRLIESEKDDIERDFGGALAWEELPEKRAARIAVYLKNADPEKREDWMRQHQWLAEQLNKLHRVLADRVRRLNAEDWDDDQEAA